MEANYPENNINITVTNDSESKWNFVDSNRKLSGNSNHNSEDDNLSFTVNRCSEQSEHSDNDSCWSDIDTDDDHHHTRKHACDFEEFVRMHSSHHDFANDAKRRGKSHSFPHINQPSTPPKLFGSRRSVTISPSRKRNSLISVDHNLNPCEIVNRSVSAPHTPSDECMKEISSVGARQTHSINEQTNDVKHANPQGIRAFKLLLKKYHQSPNDSSSNALVLKSPSHFRRWMGQGSDTSEKKTRRSTGAVDFRTRSPSPIGLRQFLSGSNLASVASMKKSRSKGHVTAEEDFQWQNSNNNVERSLSVDQSRPNTSNGSISAGTLLANESFVQPTVAGTSMSTNVTAAENGSTSFDVVDGANAVDVQKLRQDTEHLQQKILKISEAIKVEQATRDDNVSEYLKLATNADRQQAGRIKSVFEKKNQKSNATIQQLQKKLDTYHRRLRDLESGGGGKPWKVRGNLRDFSGGVVESVKGGLSGLQQVTQNAAGAIAAKPKDLASKIKSRFGSADNLHTLSNFDETLSDDFAVSNRYGSADDVSSTSGSTTDNLVQDDGRRSITTSPNKNSIVLRRDEHSQQLQEVANQLIFVKTELQEIRQSQSKSEAAWTQWKDKYITEMNFLTNSLQDEKFRNERLEVQLNDLTELHQRETCNLKQELTSMEEKVEYHAHERARDMQEALESCETRISKMELQQQQQLMPGDALESANARVLIGKLINLLMSVLAVVLVLVSAAYNISMPLFKTQGRVVTTVCAVLAFIIAYKNWTYFISVFGVYDVDQT